MKSMLVIAALAGLLSTAGDAVAAPTAAEAACSATGAEVTQRAICHDPELRRIDAAMNTALDAVLALSWPADAQVFRDSQKFWLEDRDTDCDAADDSGKPAKPAALAACIRREDQQRTSFFNGRPDEGPGAPDRIVPVMREGQGFIWSFRFLDPKSPAETLVNQKLDAQLAALHIGKPGNDADYTDSMDAELKYASPAFLSAAVEGDRLSPGSDPGAPFYYNLNVDMHTGRLLTSADAFMPGAVARLQQQCASERRDYLKLVAGETAADQAADRARLDGLVADLSQWSFGATAASLTLDPGDEGPYICHFPYKGLRPLLRGDFPLP